MSSLFGSNGLEGTSVFDYRDIGERVNSNFEGKLGNYYTKNDSDSRYPRKDAIYTKIEVDNRLIQKANSEDVYDILTTDNLLSDKANSIDVYDKLETDNLLSNKANTIDVYNKSETDNLLSNKADKSDINNNTGSGGLTAQQISSGEVYTDPELYVPTKFFDFGETRYVLPPTLDNGNSDYITIDFWLHWNDSDNKSAIWNHSLENTTLGDFISINQNQLKMRVRNITMTYPNTLDEAQDNLLSNEAIRDKWLHIAITQTPETIFLYLNGTLVKFVDFTSTERRNWSSEYNALGTDANSGDFVVDMNRHILNWKVLNYAKTQQEIANNLLTFDYDGFYSTQYIPFNAQAGKPIELVSNTTLDVYTGDASKTITEPVYTETLSDRQTLLDAFNGSPPYYDKETIDNLLNDKANKDEIYTRPELYTKNEIDILLNNGSEINNNNTFNSVFITNSTLNKYPSGVATSNNWTVSGKNYGNGTYVVSSSASLNDDAYLAFNGQPYSDYGWHSINHDTHKYDSATGAYLGTSTFEGDSGEWLKIQIPEAFILGEYKLYPRTDYATSRMPSHFKVYASTDNTNWDLVDEQTNVINREGEPSVFQISNSTAYDYYAIVVLVNGNETATSLRNTINLSEIEFYEGQVVSKIDGNGDFFVNDVKANTLDINNEVNENFLRIENTGNSGYKAYGDLSNSTVVGHSFRVLDFDQNSGLGTDCAFFSNEKNYLLIPTEIWANLSMNGNSIENVSNIYTKTETDNLLSNNVANIYTKTETDNLLSNNVANIYTKTETDNLLSTKVNSTDLKTPLYAGDQLYNVQTTSIDGTDTQRRLLSLSSLQPNTQYIVTCTLSMRPQNVASTYSNDTIVTPQIGSQQMGVGPPSYTAVGGNLAFENSSGNFSHTFIIPANDPPAYVNFRIVAKNPTTHDVIIRASISAIPM